MSTVAGGVGQGGETDGPGQVELTVRAAAEVAGVSTKQVRRWIREGTVRATKREGRHGPTWFVEAATLPPRRVSMDRPGTRSGQAATLPEQGSDQGSGEVVAGLLGMVRERDRQLDERRRELEAAAGRIGYLEGEAQQVKALAARAESLATERGQELEGHRREIGTLSEQVARLRAALRRRSWAAAILLAAFALAVAAALLR